MKLIKDSEIKQFENAASLAYINPFLPERIKLEKKVLGKIFVEEEDIWHVGNEPLIKRENVISLYAKLHEMSHDLLERISVLNEVDDKELEIYEDIILFYLYYVLNDDLEEAILEKDSIKSDQIIAKSYDKYSEFFTKFFSNKFFKSKISVDKEHLFSCFWQLRRAFYHIFTFISGHSKVSYELRASIWESIFSYDVKRYRRIIYKHTVDIPTLITGPSGSGKELVARAVGLSRYIPFDGRACCFKARYKDHFHAINLSSFSSNLVESEMFGYVKGAFTGASADKKGWFELSTAHSAFFIDEIGDLDSMIQVKLLRTLQSRTFHRIGSHSEKKFLGKTIFATHKDLSQEIINRNFREDFYYRICADTIHTPALKDILSNSKDNLQKSIAYILNKMFPIDESEILSVEISTWIEETFGLDYDWPGNFRELEQCIRNFLIKRNYQPARAVKSDSNWLKECVNQELNLEELTKLYVKEIYKKYENFETVAKKLGVDRRTIKSKLL